MSIGPRLTFCLWLGLGALIGALPVRAEEISCECPKAECGACMEEQGITFYSEKCGPDNSKVKSCAKATCVAMANPPASCKKADAKATDGRQPAQVGGGAKSLERGLEIGKIDALEGTAWLKMPDGSRVQVSLGLVVRERDAILTEKNGRVQIEFKDGNLIQVQHDTIVKVDQYEIAEEKRKAVINLLRGQIRNQVKQKYNGETSSYQVKTKIAVAGVRGTDFVASYSEGEKVETEIKTLEGRVVLANLDYSQSLEVDDDHQATYVVAANSVFGDDEISEFVARGYMTPVHKMKAGEVRQLSQVTLLGKGKRQLAAAKKSICNEPKGELNQCSWRCENNPKNEKTCRADLPDVGCVRRRCNANGQWAEETRTPASNHEQCAPQGFKVAPCDY